MKPNLPFELYVAIRYLLARRKQAFISLISLISTLGVIVGVTALLIALALMTGLQAELRDRLVGSAAHIYVWKIGGMPDPQPEIERLRQVPHVVGAAPVVEGKALIRSGHAESFINVKGIDPILETTVTEIGRAMKSGSLQALAQRDPGRPAPIVIGQDLSTTLGAFAGDTVSLLTQEGTLTPLLGFIPKSRVFRVVGTFSLGLYEFDASYGFVPLEVAQKLFNKETVDFIELRVDDMFQAPRIAEGIQSKFGDAYVVQDWADINKSIFSALWLEKVAISITIGLIVIVAALNIIASLILLVMEKSRDIAILKTMGASAGRIRTIFMLQGLIIGVVGTSVGAALGCSLIYVLDRYRLIHVPLDVYQISYVPFTLQPLDFLIVIASSVVVCFVATLYPSRQAARLDPAQALRYE